MSGKDRIRRGSPKATTDTRHNVGSTGGSLKPRASGPSVRRLRSIAVNVLGGRPSTKDNAITMDDLVSVGWLAYVHAEDRARTASFPYQAARFAMLDELRRWTRRTRYLPVDTETAEPQLTRDETEDFRCFCYRHLSGFRLTLMLQLVVNGDSLELIAERHGRTPQQARVTRAQSITRLRAALAA